MSAALEQHPGAPSAAEVASAIDAACGRIAPAWPLDRLIAVNPCWGFVGQPLEDAAAEIAALGGTRLLMPRHWYRARYQAGDFTARHVRDALALRGSRRPPEELLAELTRDETPPPVRRLLTDVSDECRDLAHGMPWGEFVTRHLSQTCAAHFDEAQARWVPERSLGLYGLWRHLAARDVSPKLLMGLRGFRALVAELPEDPRALITTAVHALAVGPEQWEGYFASLLMTVHGWASACAYRRWEARLAGGDDEQIVHLLAARLAWELVLLRLPATPDLPARWSRARRLWPDAVGAAKSLQRDDWVWQRALELAYQERLVAALAGPRTRPVATPSVQAVFCIDVRSEVYRRALEATDSTLQTAGFAGFFGLPIAYQPPAGPARPQLPGLLAPALLVRDAGAAAGAIAGRTRAAAQRAALWKELASSAASAFSYVEAVGPVAALALVRDAFGRGTPAGDPLREGLQGPRIRGLRPELAEASPGGDPIAPEALVNMAAGVLRGMSLTRGFARVIALIGHGSGTTNNPQAGGLQCGACGGQTGEVNARALAALLNDAAVRAGLATRGLGLPATTHVVAGLHNTTTDEVTLFDRDRVPDSHRRDVEEFERRLEAAGRLARRERAAALGLGECGDAELEAAVRRRASDWSEVRPEWGLARNAAFVVAPRERTRRVDLAGRCFLHEYRWEDDAGFGVLELIMTAPMVVTHWINMQYYASTVAPVRYGSGNKVLHNVVGGRLGVFEGAGGDLRIGLASQSVHDGRDWVHEPLRLSVVIEAPADAIDRVMDRHAVVRDLVANEWLFLFRIEPADGTVHHRRATGWHPLPPDGRDGG